MSIGGGVKSSHSKGLQDFGSIDACHYEQIKGLICEADFCTVLVPDSDEIERFAHSAGSETLGAWKKSKAVIQPLDYGNIKKRARQNFTAMPKTAGLPRSQDYLLPRNDMGKKVAFTLAEVLITLGIIGVVAALTLPSLIQSYKRKEATSRLKKFYSMMYQAVLLAEEEQGIPTRRWTGYSETYYDTNDAESMAQANADSYNYWNHYLAKYVKTLKVEQGVYDADNNTNTNTIVYFADGTSCTLDLNGRAMTMLFDVNGDKNPNQAGRDRFYFLIPTSTTVNSHEMAENVSFGVGWLPYLDTREKALNRCKTNTLYCTTLLMYDDFEFKSDYPYNI